jgi:hypothetical protein
MLKNVLISTAASYPTAASPYLLASGEVGVYSQALDGTYTLITAAISAAQAKLPVVIAQGVPAGKQIKLFAIQPGQKTAYSYNGYTAPVPNVFIAGYDGVTAAYNLASGIAGTYDFKVQNLTVGNPPFPTLGSTPFFQTAAAATSVAIANAVVKDLNEQTLNINNDVMPQYKFALSEVLSVGVTAAPTSTPTATVTNGSTTVTLSVTSVDLVNGAYIKFGSATATTSAVYQIVSGGGTTTLTLASPYVNPSVSLGTAISGLTTGFATGATIAAANAGIRVTECFNMFNGSSVQEPYPNKIMNISCNINLSGTVVQNNQIVTRSYTAAGGGTTTGIYTEGNGTYAQVFKAELTAAGYIGFINRTFLPDNFPLYSVSTATYGIFGLSFSAPAKDYTAQNFKFGELQDALIALSNTGGTQQSTLATVLASTNW